MIGFFEIVRDGDSLIVIPTIDLRETVFERLCDETTNILAAFDGTTTRHLIMDFHRTQEFGSTAIGYFVTLWKRIRERNGRMAFCNLTPYEKEILHVTRLDQLWPLCATREDALKVVREST